MLSETKKDSSYYCIRPRRQKCGNRIMCREEGNPRRQKCGSWISDSHEIANRKAWKMWVLDYIIFPRRQICGAEIIFGQSIFFRGRRQKNGGGALGFKDSFLLKEGSVRKKKSCSAIYTTSTFILSWYAPIWNGLFKAGAFSQLK